MHEFHTTETILKNALLHAQEAKAARITDVHFVIGEISTYTDDSIQGAWEILAKGTKRRGIMQDSWLSINSPGSVEPVLRKVTFLPTSLLPILRVTPSF